MRTHLTNFNLKYWLVALLLLIPGVAFADPLVMCAEDGAPPAGYVKTSVVRATHCATGYGATIELPQPNMLVCVTSPIPSPYVIVGGDPNTSVCRGLGRHLINIAATGMYICSNSPIPNGFVIVQNAGSAGPCSVGQFRISAVAEGIIVCGNTPIPNPYVVTSVSSSSGCGVYFPTFRLNQAYDGIVACVQSPVPTGYVVTNIYSNGCGMWESHRFALPYYNIIVCPTSPIPAGWANAGNKSVNGACGGTWTTGPQLRPI